MTRQLAPPTRSLSARVTLVVAVALFLGLAAYMRRVESEAVRAVELDVASEEGARRSAAGAGAPAVASIARAVRAMELVAVRLETAVNVVTREESWRGDVAAHVRVPVTLLYGTDMAAAEVEGVNIGGMVRVYTVTTPPPRRLATEVDGDHEEASVEAGWARLRSMGGERMLGLARKSVAGEARRMVLTAEDTRLVRGETRERVAELVRAVAGENARVVVRFQDEPEPVAPTAEADAGAVAPGDGG